MSKLTYLSGNKLLKKLVGAELTDAVKGEIQSLFMLTLSYHGDIHVAKFEDFPHNGYAIDIVVNVNLLNIHVGTIFLERISSESYGNVEEIVLYPVASRFMREVIAQ